MGVALLGLALFTADPSSNGASIEGDAACVLAACAYAAYDLRLFVWVRAAAATDPISSARDRVEIS